uniref:BTB domain-containing protein n=1 Tax=Panagrolaimus davidi TaxID=227884 RepID=A0A914R0M4_9BILA
MSLFFEERINEQKEDDPENDKITFIFSFAKEIPLVNENNEDRQFNCSKTWVTTYNVTFKKWIITLSKNHFYIFPSTGDGWNATCNVSYNLYYDNDMRFEIYSSPKISAIFNPDHVNFKSPEGFLAKFSDAFQRGKVAKIVVFVELKIPLKHFFRPFDLRLNYFKRKISGEYPENWENDYRFEFLKDGDYSIKCSDGHSMPALKMVLNVSSNFIRDHFAELTENELIVGHKIDVIKPVILYLHSLCFQMPKSYNLDFVDRLLEAIDFFNPEHRDEIEKVIEHSLCNKFVGEPSNFDSVLQWFKISLKHELTVLLKMISTLIANKYYFQWDQTFHRNIYENPLFFDIFGPEGHILIQERGSLVRRTFVSIFSTFKNSFFTKTILN